jgi:hypothetical protein
MPPKNETTICYSGVYKKRNDHHTEKEAIKIAEKICKKGPYCPNTKKISSVVSYLGASQISKTLCDKQVKNNKIISKIVSKLNIKYKKYLDKVQVELQEHSKLTGVPVEKYAPDVVAKIIAAKCGKLVNEIYMLELEMKRLS